jgi:pimeloyl-ACP methyl ester carboxylesterase
MNKQIEIAGKKIFYRVYGNGKPVMLVHGFGETGDVWKNQIAYLQSSFQLIVPDLPGSGESDMIDDMSMEGWQK